MSEHVDVQFIWHMHQPPYMTVDGSPPQMPWVRLHAIKSYHDMAWLLARHPDVHMVVNFTPCLLEQLEALTEHGVRDTWWSLSKRAPSELSRDERRFIVEHFFSLAHARFVHPNPGYARLLAMRERPDDWSEQDLLDLQVLFNLCWFGFGARAEHPDLDRLVERGQGFSAADKARVLELQLEVARSVLPRYRALVERGQLELCTTPYAHPILPLLCDTTVAARPGRAMPERFMWPEDAREHIRRGIRIFERCFGQPPRGMWPAEGSVSDAAVALFEEAGLSWIATDEQNLLLTDAGEPGASRADRLYHPYLVGAEERLGIFFRDTGLSDRIGFVYRQNTPEVAVADLLQRLRGIGAGGAGRLVTVILDGENPWEHYEDDGRPFLEELARELSGDDRVSTVLPSTVLERAPVSRHLQHIHAGSWIEADFRIWIGQVVKNRGWDLLGEVRRRIARQHRSGHSRAAWEKALKALLCAEASDWFWWFGDDFHSEQDALFDALFRAHLRSALVALGMPVPDALHQPVDGERRSLDTPLALTPPAGPIRPAIDGACERYFDWLHAGHYLVGGEQGSMYRSAHGIAQVFFGGDPEHLYLRFDFQEGWPLSDADWSLTIYTESAAQARRLVLFRSEAPDVLLLREVAEGSEALEVPTVSLGRSLVMGVPVAALGASPGEPLQWSATLHNDGVEVGAIPESGAIQVEPRGGSAWWV